MKSTRSLQARQAVKRMLDVVAAAINLVVAAPVIAVVAVAVLVTQGRPVFFRHERPGLNGRPFTMIKFRTMRPTRGDEIWFQTDEQRVTSLGRFLRATSLDELPELVNVVRGEMSMVGPRPLLTEYLDYYSPDQARRHDVRPGVTGWAVVNGRHVLKFDERLALDVWYVDHWSLHLDAKIMAMTLRQMVSRDGVAVTQNLADIGFPLPGVPRADPPARSRDETSGEDQPPLAPRA